MINYLDKKSKKKIISNLQAYANKNFEDDQIQENYEDKSYWAIIDALKEFKEIRSIWDQDIASYGLIQSLNSLYNKTPIKVSEKDFSSIFEKVKKTLANNVADHLIVCPIPGAQFKRTIRFSNVIIIPQHFTERRKLKLLNEFVEKDINLLKHDVEHTTNSRSRDFLNYPLLCINRSAQTSFIRYQAQNLVQSIICSLRVYYYGNIFKTKNDKTSKFVIWSVSSLKEASHLAVYAKDNWRSNHNPLRFDPNIKFDISWLSKKKYRDDFLGFYSSIYLNGAFDKFHLIFFNSLYLFSDLIGQTKSIQTILLMTICESILAQSKNEKRLRTSSIIPEVISRKPLSNKEISFLISDLYEKRNNFVHSAEEVTIDYNFENNDPDQLEFGKIIAASLIVNYPNLLNLIDDNLKDVKLIGKETKMNEWSKYLDQKFKDKLYTE